MYKLVAIGGKIRGKEVILHEGENIVGRGNEVDHNLTLQGLSKKHMCLTVNEGKVYIEDLGSSNGTFVNGKIIKRQALNKDDKIAVPNAIFQLVYVKEKKVSLKNTESKEDVEIEQREVVPNHLPGKIRFHFKKKIMPIIYGFNEQYEWSQLVAILLGLFIIINIALTIFPVLRTNKNILVYEIALRGKHYADEVARINNVALQRRNLEQINTNFLDKEDGVVSYELFDLEGRVVRPLNQLNSYTNDTLSIETRDWIQKNAKPLIKILSDGKIGIGGAIKAYDVRTGREEVVGGISIRFSPRSLTAEAANSSQAYFEALSTSILVAIFFFAMIYYLTTRHIEQMQLQIEESLRGKRKELESKLLMKESIPLKNTINSVLQRLRELQSTDEGGFDELEDDGPYLRKLEDFLSGAQGPVLILNSEKNINRINLEGEDLMGIRESSSSGMSLLDTARDQGFAATVIDLCDQSANNDGCNQKETYEIGGHEYEINVASLMGKDGFAKAFYITFVRES